MRRDDGGEFWYIIVGAVVGAITGALATTGARYLACGITNAVVDGVEYIATQTITGQEINEMELLGTMVFSGVTAGKGMDASNLKGLYKHSTNVLKTAVSETKRALYRSKICFAKKNVLKL